MGRPQRVAQGGYVYHVLNRANARLPLFKKDRDYAAFEHVLAEAQQRLPVPLLAYCLMPNHWHLVLWPPEDGQLSRFLNWLTLTHTQRWHAHYHNTGTGHLYQGRFKSFPVQDDEHYLTVCRYVERNPLRAGLVARCADWRWGSHWRRQHTAAEPPLALSEGPLPLPPRWARWVAEAQSAAEVEALRGCVQRGRPFGAEAWVLATAERLHLGGTLRPRGRPRKAPPSNKGS